MDAQFKTYGLNGEAETRLEREMIAIYKAITDAQLEKKFTVPNVSTVPANKPFLAKDGANWYIYVRMESQFYRVLLTAV